MMQHHESIYFTKISLCLLTKMDPRLQYMISALVDFVCVLLWWRRDGRGGGGSDHRTIVLWV